MPIVVRTRVRPTSQNAARDDKVPAVFAKKLRIQLDRIDLSTPDRHRDVEFPRSGHFMIEEEWTRL